MKKFKFMSLLLCLLLALQCAIVPAMATETETGTESTTVPETTGAVYDIPDDVSGDASITSRCATINGMQPLATDSSIAATAKGAFLYEMTTGTVIYAKNPDAKLYPASLTKVMTALIALEHANLDEMVTVSVAAVSNMDPEATLAYLVLQRRPQTDGQHPECRPVLPAHALQEPRRARSWRADPQYVRR